MCFRYLRVSLTVCRQHGGGRSGLEGKCANKRGIIYLNMAKCSLTIFYLLSSSAMMTPMVYLPGWPIPIIV